MDKLYAQLEVMMVVCRHFKEAWTAFSKQGATTQVDEHITSHYPTAPTLTPALKRTAAGWCSEEARCRTRICPCPNNMLIIIRLINKYSFVSHCLPDAGCNASS